MRGENSRLFLSQPYRHTMKNKHERWDTQWKTLRPLDQQGRGDREKWVLKVKSPMRETDREREKNKSPY